MTYKVIVLLIAVFTGMGAILGSDIWNDYYIPKTLTIARVQHPQRKLDVQDYAWESARKNKLDRVKFVCTIWNESKFNPEAIGINVQKNGVRSVDLGIAQINSRYHKEISLAERLDPYKSIDWMAKKVKTVGYSLWYGEAK